MLNYLSLNIDITDLSGFKTRAIAKYYFEINYKEDIYKLSEIYNFSKENNLSFLILGGGKNCLFAFDVFDGVIIKNNLKGFELFKDNVNIMSGEDISFVCEKLRNDHDIENLFPWIGLPGTLGGAVYGNAGCFGLRVEDVFLKAEIYDILDNKIINVDKEFMDFKYRSSYLKNNNRFFLISALLNVGHKVDTITYEEVVDFRNNKQPNGLSCGSFFINPDGQSAGRMIDESGLKGYKINGAYISDLHANFIMSDGTANYNDLLELIKYCKETIFNKTGFDLKPEVNIIFNTGVDL